MQFSTKVRYAVRAMIELAAHKEKGPLQLREIAANQDISDKYLEQVMLPLRTSGMVFTKRGSQGGYLLKKDPAEITVADIVYTVEGSIAPVACVNVPGSCNRIDECVVHDVWSKVAAAVDRELKSFTLADLAAKQLKLKKKGSTTDFQI